MVTLACSFYLFEGRMKEKNKRNEKPKFQMGKPRAQNTKLRSLMSYTSLCCPSPSPISAKMRNKDSLTKNAHVISAVLLGFLYDGRQRVGEILEQGVLLLDLHA